MGQAQGQPCSSGRSATPISSLFPGQVLLSAPSLYHPDGGASLRTGRVSDFISVPLQFFERTWHTWDLRTRVATLPLLRVLYAKGLGHCPGGPFVSLWHCPAHIDITGLYIRLTQGWGDAGLCVSIIPELLGLCVLFTVLCLGRFGQNLNARLPSTGRGFRSGCNH